MVISIGTSISQPYFALANNEVYVWSASLQQPTNVVEQLYTLLSTDEKARAARFHFEHLRRSFVVARGVLRALVARYTNHEPRQLEFQYEAAGKPQLSDKFDKKILFNLSHSHEIVLYAFSGSRNVGIDIEHIRIITDLEKIAERNFSAREFSQLRALLPAQTLKAFFNCWTRKEAFIKAIGDGISFPLDQFDVSLKPDEPAELLSVFGSIQNAKRWSMHELKTLNSYVAALVVEGNGFSISYQEWNYLESANTYWSKK